jgi:RNA polymerase sigma-70 factor (ECF subfamily)
MAAPPTSSTELAERHRGEILRYLLRLLGNADDAQDACQQTFLHAHRAFGRLRADSNVRAWLFRIATNTARSAARGHARRTRPLVHVELDGLPGERSASLEQREQLRAVARAVQALPARQRAALMLRRFEGFDYCEIASCLGGNEAAARANVYQALKKLRAVLEDHA